MVDREMFTYLKINKKFKIVNGAVWRKLTNLYSTLIIWDNVFNVPL